MSETSQAEPQHSTEPDPRRWKALAFISIAQLMIVVDGTIVNIALPSVQTDLGISDGNRAWVITAYALAFGGLLLLGGRVADMWGRKNTFLTGLLGFAGASAIGGAAVNELMMYASRGLQGAFGALMAPAALSLLAVTFTEGKERAKAFGIFGAIAGGGAAIGLILGGVLTEYLDWRWVFFVNIPIATIAFVGAIAQVHEPKGTRNRSPLDIPGTVLGTLGLVALVYGFTRAESEGWTESGTVSMFVLTAVLLAAFVAVERKVKAPLLPLRVVLDRNRGGIYLSLALAIIAMFGLFLFLTFYMQVVKGYTPVRSGVAFLPMVVGMITGSTQIGARLMTRIPARYLMTPGLLVAATGMLILTQMEVDSSYVSQLLPAQLLLGLGLGTVFMPAMSLATYRVEPRDSGIASAMVNTSQQVGGAIGTALLNTIAASATTTYLAANIAGAASPEMVQLQGLVHGYTEAIWWAVGILVVAAGIAFALVNADPTSEQAAFEGADPEEGATAPVAVH